MFQWEESTSDARFKTLIIAFDEAGQRVFISIGNSNSVSIIELNNANNVIDVDLSASGGLGPAAIAFDAAGQRVFTDNANSASASIISNFPTVAKICQDSGFDTGDIRKFCFRIIYLTNTNM